MSEATIRAQIKSVTAGVSGVGVVHDYERWTTDFEGLKAQFVSGGMLKGWIVTCRGWSNQVITFGMTDSVLRTYTHAVRGFWALDDSAGTEKLMAALAETVQAALEADATLRGEVLERETPVVAETRLDHVIFAEVLCCHAELVVRAQEVVSS